MVAETEDLVCIVFVLGLLLVAFFYVYYYIKFQEWSKHVVRTSSFIMLRPKEIITQIERVPVVGNYIVEVFCKDYPRQGYFIRLELNINPLTLTNRLTLLYWLSYYLSRHFIGFRNFVIRDYAIYRYPHPNTINGICDDLLDRHKALFE